MKTIRLLCLTVVLCLLSAMRVQADNGSGFAANRTDFRDESIYFAMTTRFYDGDPANNVLCWDNQEAQVSTKDPCWRGDFQGLIDQLDYIKALGFTAIWITPVVQNASGYDYHGYHASDFTKVDCRYQSGDGSKSGDVMFQSLIDAAHRKGIKIILDIVLNHTGNFGEETLCKEFTRSTSLNLQGSAACLTPNATTLGSGYDDLTPANQYQRRLALMKNTDGQNHDTHNYWHHVGNGWNWDEPSRWWGQIAGDCVDLNTENPAVTNYLVKCYEQFIKMGVDGFRIDTSGHISRLSFNKAFIPQFTALGQQYASARAMYGGSATGSPFYMFGEVCARFSGVTYRDQPNLSPYYYTWASSSSLLGQWNNDASWWDNQTVKEGADPLGNMTLCLQEASDQPTSDNAVLVNGAYHAPDYSKASGFNVIDFPVHYNFTSVGSAYGMATGGDKYYNDATWNVVYVDSHDYGPQPNDQVRFSGGTNQWADNLTWMFFFRGIPCIYYGSEIEFQAGKKIDNGPNGPLSDTGRAYFGQNLEGSINASDFGIFTASGQVAKTLNHPLAQHLKRLNRIRQAVPALRKGQYTTDGCTANGGWAWKKRYTAGGVDSYALVCMDGGATFTGIPNGTYTDCVTGDVKTVGNGTLTVSCPSNQGNARVYVLNGPGKIGDDGPFLYASSPASADNSGSVADPGTTWNEVSEAQHPTMTLSPNGGTFTTNTLDITLTQANATSGWYQVDNGQQVAFTGSTTVTIGADMNYGDSRTIAWSVTATNNDNTETVTGQATYKKADPNAAITIYCKASAAPYLYAWSVSGGTTTELNGKWPGTMMTSTTTIDGVSYYYQSFTGVQSINLIFNNGSGQQTKDISDITASTMFTYDGGSGYTIIEQTPVEQPETPAENSIHCYFINSGRWATIRLYAWDQNSNNAAYAGDWNNRYTFTASDKVGTTTDGYDIYRWTYTGTLTGMPTGIIFTSANDSERAGGGDMAFVNGAYYNAAGKASAPTTTAINALNTGAATGKTVIYDLNGRRVAEVSDITQAEYLLKSGIYVIDGRKFVIK